MKTLWAIASPANYITSAGDNVGAEVLVRQGYDATLVARYADGEPTNHMFVWKRDDETLVVSKAKATWHIIYAGVAIAHTEVIGDDLDLRTILETAAVRFDADLKSHYREFICQHMHIKCVVNSTHIPSYALDKALAFSGVVKGPRVTHDTGYYMYCEGKIWREKGHVYYPYEPGIVLPTHVFKYTEFGIEAKVTFINNDTMLIVHNGTGVVEKYYSKVLSEIKTKVLRSIIGSHYCNALTTDTDKKYVFSVDALIPKANEKVEFDMREVVKLVDNTGDVPEFVGTHWGKPLTWLLDIPYDFTPAANEPLMVKTTVRVLFQVCMRHLQDVGDELMFVDYALLGIMNMFGFHDLMKACKPTSYPVVMAKFGI